MRVMVIGSQPRGSDSKVVPPSEAFIKFCRALGETLAAAKHEIIIMSDAGDTFDFHAAIGVDRRGGTVTAVWPKDKSHPTPQIPGLNSEIYCIPSDTGLASGRLQQIRLSDIVLMVGGNDKTREALPLCLALQKPFLPIPQFGGASREVFQRLMELLELHQKEMIDPMRELSRQRISETTTGNELEATCKGIVELLPKLKKNNPAAKDSFPVEIRNFLAVVVAVSMAISGGWLSYKYMNLLPVALCLFGSIILGSILTVYFGPNGVAGQFGASGAAKTMRNSSRGAIVSVATLALIAFAQFPTTGKVNPTAFLSDGGDYIRIAIVVFLIGFACAWRYESWEDGLNRRISEFRGSLK